MVPIPKGHQGIDSIPLPGPVFRFIPSIMESACLPAIALLPVSVPHPGRMFLNSRNPVNFSPEFRIEKVHTGKSIIITVNQYRRNDILKFLR